MTREEWNDSGFASQELPPWRIATWRERLLIVFIWLLLTVIGIGMVIGALLVLGAIVDNQDKRSSEYRLCLKHAENGYEMKQCDNPSFR